MPPGSRSNFGHMQFSNMTNAELISANRDMSKVIISKNREIGHLHTTTVKVRMTQRRPLLSVLQEASSRSNVMMMAYELVQGVYHKQQFSRQFHMHGSDMCASMHSPRKRPLQEPARFGAGANGRANSQLPRQSISHHWPSIQWQQAW